MWKAYTGRTVHSGAWSDATDAWLVSIKIGGLEFFEGVNGPTEEVAKACAILWV